MPSDELTGIAVEGLAPADRAAASAEAIEVADLVLYYGKSAAFNAADAVVILQFKYSIGSESVPFRASDASKTVGKFAAAFRSYRRKYGAKSVREKLQFELITNRPVHQAFEEAVSGIASGGPLKGDAKKQATQFKAACRLRKTALLEFAQKFRVTGFAGSLRKNKQALSRIIADWSPAADAMARARLGNMRQLLRDKAGSEGEGRNVIRRTDVLDALELQSLDDLFPCPESFPEVGTVVRREQLPAAVKMIPKLDTPLLIHAAGGLGKTVFLQSLAKALSKSHETVLFDCFGGGSYRAPEDNRHLPKRGLIHIANSLACRGLCDPLLPVSENVEDLIKAFRARLAQAVSALRRESPGKQLLLFIDAIDNAAEHAKDKGERAFPTLLLESFHYNGPVPGVQLIVSCRTHRRDISRGQVPCEEFRLDPFTPKEAEQYVRDRIEKVTDTQVQVACSRSSGNPRILEHLVGSDRGLLDASELGNKIELDDLLRARIQKALEEARRRGYPESDINAFLAGLSVLPPPVPPREYADAHGMDVTAVDSFAADLAPLLEQTRHGLTFRDEPTETLVRESYAAGAEALHTLAANLIKKQGESVYAASALPGLLEKLEDEKLLFELAFDERFPAAITSTVGKLNIRYARLKAAVRHAARKGNFNRLVHLLLELSTLAAVNERGTDYILDNPDLVIASQDIDATRRLFETRTCWPGTRYARLAIASVLAGDLSDAYRHAINANEWIGHHYRQSDDARRDRGGPEKLDLASIPLCLVAQNRGAEAARYLTRWKDWYAYEVSEHLFALLDQAQATQAIAPEQVNDFLAAIEQPGLLAGALSFPELDAPTRRRLIVQLAKACGKKKSIETNGGFHRERDYILEDGFLKAGAIAISMGLHADARAITALVPHERPRLWSYADRYSTANLLPFVCFSALTAAQGVALGARALLPAELTDLAARVPAGLAGAEFRKALKAEIEKQFDSEKGLPDDKRSMRYDTKREAERFIDERLELLLEMAQAFAAVATSAAGKGDKPFLALLDTWSKLRKKREHYSDISERNLFFDLLGMHLLIFSLWSRSDLEAATAEAFVRKAIEDGVTTASTLVKIAAILAMRPQLGGLAGQAAVKARALAEQEDEVGQRAGLFARLSKAILPASSAEAAAYFRMGLEQMDAIGSGDYQFTNELLIFASELRGGELEEKDFHTLSNICELNMSSDAEKFPWVAFARGLARTSGCRTLAKLGRWHDRSKISLDYTLLPYVAALLEQDKIDPCRALSLLRLSEPAEFHSCGTAELARIIEQKRYPEAKALVAELIDQFGRNHPGVFMPDTVGTLSEVAERVLGKESEQSAYLSVAAARFRTTRDEENENRNYRGAADRPLSSSPPEDTEEKDRLALQKTVRETNPVEESAVSRALDAVEATRHSFELKKAFFEGLRQKVGFPDRAKYINVVARLDNLDIYAKLEELNACKEKWSGSSAALADAFKAIGIPLVQIHADDFVSHDYFSGSKLKEAADLSGVPMRTLALELIALFAAPDSHLPASVWMGIASAICGHADPGEGEAALKRLLNSSAAKLSSSVVDGAWKEGLYPAANETEIAAGLVWLSLGSPSAADRWRAAHSVRTLARFGKWDAIDALVAKLSATDAHPYQAPELVFYFLHARLWLLIALARVALDYPSEVAKYKDALKRAALDGDMPHVLLRHFAARALLTCADKGSAKLSKADINALKAMNTSPFPRKEARTHARDSFYDPRPVPMPKPIPEFSLDYDFAKSRIQGISDIFDRPRWEVEYTLTAWVRKFDPAITSMYERGGRDTSQRHQLRGMTPQHHTYGQQLGWHALFLTAGEFLARYPVTKSPYGGDDDDPWHEWLDRELLTRKDGLWLADGVDRPPIEIQVNLLEKGEKGLVLTSSKEKVLAAAGIDGPIKGSLAVGGHWRSNDGIEVHLSSALASPAQAGKLALELSKEDAFQAWLPFFEGYDDDDEFSRSEKPGCTPWIVCASTVVRLDETDPLAAHSVVRRMQFTKDVNALGPLQPTDAFKRAWTSPTGEIVARSEAWGRNSTREDGGSDSGERLVCSAEFLRTVLQAKKTELLLLIILRRYEKELSSRPSQYWHTTAVVRIEPSLQFESYTGSQNQLHVSRF